MLAGEGDVVHLTGVEDQGRTSKKAIQGGLFTISGIKYQKAVVKRESALKVIGGSKFKINNDTCEGCT